nr:odorant receptor 90 [Graphosoma rubrolineatum]
MHWPWKRRNLSDVWKWPVISWLNMFGCWGEEEKTESGRKWRIRVRTLTMIFLPYLLMSMLIQGFLKFSEGDIMQNLFTVFAAGPGTVGLFKFFNVILYRKQLKSVMDRLSAMLSEADNPKLQQIARTSLKRTWILFIACLSVFTCSIMDWLMRPPIVAIIHHEKTRIVDSWPVFLDTWLQWFFSYLLQCPGILLLGHSNYMYEVLYFCTSDVILCHFKLLRHKLNHLVLSNNRKSTEELISCVKYYTMLLSVCEDFKKSYIKGSYMAVP